MGISTYHKTSLFLPVLVLTLTQLPVFGNDLLVIDQLDKAQHDLIPHLTILEDSAGKWRFEDLMQKEFPFQHSPKISEGQPLSPESVWWLRARVKSNHKIAGEWMLINRGTGIVDVWLIDSLGNEQHFRSGRYLKAKEKVLNMGDFIHVPLSLEKGHTYSLLIRMEEIDHQAIPINWQLYEPSYWFQARYQWRANSETYRFFQGVFWIMIIYNLILFIRLGSRAYLYYAAYLLCISGFVAFSVGTMTYPGFGDPRWLTPLGYLAFGGINVFYYQFGRQFLSLHELLPKWDRLLARYVGLKVLLLIAMQVQLYTYFSIPLVLLVEFAMLLLDVIINIFLFISILKTKNTLGFYFVAGSASVIVLGLSSAVIGHLNPFPYSYTIFLISVVIEMICFSLGLSFRFRKNEMEKREAQEALNKELSKINTAFGRFVPHEFIRSLGYESILDVSLGDSVEKIVTVLFSDIRSYTSLSERMSPEENFNFLNAYLGRMGPIIQANNGFVNQYYGDGIMALFLQEPKDALKAGLEMLQTLETYNTEREDDGKVPIQIGIGIHTGPLMMGVIGDTLRLEAGVVSDTVNTAARMEGLTKFYQSKLLISGETFKGLQKTGNYDLRWLGKVQVKGRKEAVSVYESYAYDAPETRQSKARTKEDFNEALKAYFAANFSAAASLLDRVLQRSGKDVTAQRYKDYCIEYLMKGIPDGWTGVETMSEK